MWKTGTKGERGRGKRRTQKRENEHRIRIFLFFLFSFFLLSRRIKVIRPSFVKLISLSKRNNLNAIKDTGYLRFVSFSRYRLRSIHRCTYNRCVYTREISVFFVHRRFFVMEKRRRRRRRRKKDFRKRESNLSALTTHSSRNFFIPSTSFSHYPF